MSALKEHFERLMKFAKQCDFHKPFSQVYFVEEKSIHRFFDLNKADEISQQNIFTFKNYENRFNELLNQGHSWINLNFAGMLNNDLLIVVEIPNYENTIEFTSVNISGPNTRVLENDWSLNFLIKII